MSLQLQLHPAYQATCSSLAGIAAALKLAGKQRSSSSNAAGGRGLALVSFEAPASTVALLQALPAATLTRLDPGTLVHAELDERITAPRKALQRLTSLQELVLHQGDANTLLQATSKLLQLRRLSAQQLSAAGVGAFKHLPPQLQSCTFTADLSGGMTGLPAEEDLAANSQQQQQQSPASAASMSTRRSSRSSAQKLHAAPPTAAPCLLNSPVLPVLLQHPCMRHVSIICSLLCTAKALEQPIAQYLRGQLAVQCNVQQKGAGGCQLRSDFIDWLAQHACLAMNLQLQLHPAYQATCSSLAGIAAALKLAGKQRSSSSNAAAAGGRGLALVSFEAPASTVALLQALPAATLTRLDPGTLVHAELDERITAPRKALQRLTSLQELVLHQGDANTLLQATSKLLQLRRLSAQQLSAAGVGAFKHLPPQLQSCTFTADLSGGMTGLPAEEVSGDTPAAAAAAAAAALWSCACGGGDR
uniref:Uncharacterized protein n=1 Tax=Tetradesmus obliquus TaxID=3088 RepID=A0A383WEF4_TETOB|eukprot:jgi/Sobl393_1/4943/SZX75623.1